MGFIKKLGMLGEFALLFMIVGVFNACTPGRKCVEFGYLDKVTVVSGFYKGQTGVVIKTWKGWDACERPYEVQLNNGLVIHVWMDEEELISND